MDFATRDQYRHMVERISKLADVSEADVAGRTVELARQGCDEYGLDHPRAHVGYYLLDVGIAELERDTGARLSWTQRSDDRRGGVEGGRTCEYQWSGHK